MKIKALELVKKLLLRYDGVVFRPYRIIGFRLVLFLAACEVLQPLVASDLPAVKGRILDPTREPLFGAKITLVSMSDTDQIIEVRSDRDGQYSVDAMPDGSYYVEATMDGFITVRYTTIQFRFSAPHQELDFVLPIKWSDTTWVDTFPSTYATLIGQLKRGDKPLQNANICMVGKEKESCTRSNRLGHYFLNVPVGAYQARVHDEAGELIYDRLINLKRGTEYENVISNISESRGPR